MEKPLKDLIKEELTVDEQEIVGRFCPGLSGSYASLKRAK